MDEHDKDRYSERPPDSDFQQQNLKAWQPLLTPKWVIGTFFAISAIFLPIGIVIIEESNKCQQVETMYSDVKCLEAGKTEPCMKEVNITIEEDMGGDGKNIYFYYKLTNFYQNHRRYVKSRDDAQLRGQEPASLANCEPLPSWPDVGNCGADSDCDAYGSDTGLTCSGEGSEYKRCTKTCNNSTPCPQNFICDEEVEMCKVDPTTAQSKSLYPCGLIANSVFNDTFQAFVVSSTSSGSKKNITWTDKGIAWDSDVKEKFKEMDPIDYNTFTRVGPGEFELPDVTDEAFMVWMRTAGLPTFKKLRYIIQGAEFKAGDIVMVRIMDNFPSKKFDGDKFIELATTSWLGGKNLFLGYAYIVVAVLCFLFAVVFTVKHLMCPRELGDMKYFNWDNSSHK